MCTLNLRLNLCSLAAAERPETQSTERESDSGVPERGDCSVSDVPVRNASTRADCSISDFPRSKSRVFRFGGNRSQCEPRLMRFDHSFCDYSPLSTDFNGRADRPRRKASKKRRTSRRGGGRKYAKSTISSSFVSLCSHFFSFSFLSLSFCSLFLLSPSLDFKALCFLWHSRSSFSPSARLARSLHHFVIFVCLVFI